MRSIRKDDRQAEHRLNADYLGAIAIMIGGTPVGPIGVQWGLPASLRIFMVWRRGAVRRRGG